MNVSYYIRKGRVNKQGRTVLMLDITWRGYRLQCSSGTLVTPKYYTPAGKKLIAAAEENSLALNWKLGQLKLNLIEQYLLLSHKDGLPVEFSVVAMQELVARLTGKVLHKAVVQSKPVVVAPVVETIWDIHAKWQQASRNKYSASHLRKFSPVQQWLNAYSPAFSLDLLTEQWVDAYMDWLLDNTELGNASLNIHIAFFRTMLKFQRLPSDWLTVKFSENEVEVDLTYEEMLAVYTTSYPTRSLRRVADAYVFLCQVGLRYGDYLTDFTLQPIQVGGETIQTIQLRQGKTKQNVTVPLNELALTIWQQYSGTLPKYAASHFNEVLKVVGVQAGLTRLVEVETVRGRNYTKSQHVLHTLLTAHTARHTFASLLLEATGNKDLAQQGLGHSSPSSTGVYARPKTAKQIEDTLNAWKALQNP